MDNITNKRYEMLKRVRDFGATQTAVFPNGSLGKELFSTVAQAVTELEGHSTSQASGKGAAKALAQPNPQSARICAK